MHCEALERATRTARAEKLATLLHEQARGSRLDPTTLADRDYVEDCLQIERVQPGMLWFARYQADASRYDDH
jgi:hypothetical protein